MGSLETIDDEEDIPEVTATISGDKDQGFTVTYQNLDANSKTAKVFVSKQGEKDDIGQSTNYSVSGKDTVTVTILETIEPGNYTVHAQLEDNDTDLDTEDFTIEAKIPAVTASISGDKDQGFTVTYSNLTENEKTSKVIVTKQEDTQDIGTESNYSTQGTDSVKVTILETIQPGNYTVRARLTDDETDLDTSDFTIDPKPSAKITKDQDTVYKVTFENAEEKTKTAKLYQNDGQEEVTSDGKYRLDNDNTNEITVTFEDGLESGQYKLKALIDTETVLATEDVDYTKAEA